MSQAVQLSVDPLPDALHPASAAAQPPDAVSGAPVAVVQETFTWTPPETTTLDALPDRARHVYPGAAQTPFAGRRFFVPVARVATRTLTSRVPAVFLEPRGDA
jgi:hypothetical protein